MEPSRTGLQEVDMRLRDESDEAEKTQSDCGEALPANHDAHRFHGLSLIAGIDADHVITRDSTKVENSKRYSYAMRCFRVGYWVVDS
jgi:hypothetical protein